VFAVNEIGESEALKTNKAMLAKEKYTVSLPPGQPTVSEWNERSMTLNWEDPIDDGNTAITGYIIEAKRANVGSWQIWETLDCKDNKVVLQKLTKGHEYQFRVIAVNKAGRSEASHASRPKMAKETDLMPFVDARNMTDVTAEAKERVKLDVGIHGEPAPEITWYKGEGENKVPVESLNDKSIQMMQTDTHAKLIFNNITTAQAGTYSIVARNKSGEDAASGRIKVLDRPAAPEAPMKISIEDGDATLFWKPSKHDGGCTIEHYQLEKMDSTKDTWAACGHTLGNTYVLPNLAPNTYTFRVFAVNRLGDSDPCTSSAITIDADGMCRGL
jgi:predicted phage tail protein